MNNFLGSVWFDIITFIICTIFVIVLWYKAYKVEQEWNGPSGYFILMSVFPMLGWIYLIAKYILS